MSEPREPVVVAGYRLLEPLGAGGEGAVWLAEGTDGLGKRVALKLFVPAARPRFERELEAYRRVEAARARTGTPHLLEGLAAGALPDGGGFVALAWQTGGTLDDLVRRSGPRPPADAVALALQVTRALAVLHAEGLCHRDVKPSNVLLGADGVARLGDLGLATDHRGAISTGGTPAFAAPEQWTDGPGEPARSGVAIDVFGCAATLHFLLSGRPPPLGGGADVFALEARHAPRALQAVLHRALDPRLDARHADARDLARDLEAACSLGAPPSSSAPGSRLAPMLAMVGVGVAAAAVILALRTPPGPAPGRAAGIVAAPSSGSTTAVEDAPARLAPIVSAPSPGLERRRIAGGIELALGSRRLGRVPRGALAALDGDRVVVAVPPLDDRPARLEAWSLAGEGEVDPRSVRTIATLADLPTRLLAADGSVVIGLCDGSAWRVAADEVPIEVARFARSVERLSRADDGSFVIEGDDRTPTPLKAGALIPPGTVLIEGALERWVIASTPLMRTVVVR